MSYEIKKLDEVLAHFLPQKQQPFDVIGRLIPIYDGKEWKSSEKIFEQKEEKIYPNESYDSSTYINNKNEVAFLAMIDGECVGSIRVCKRWNGYAFIDDLLVDRIHRGHGVGKMLMDAALKWGRENGCNGLSLETQDNNLWACRFYLKYGFKLGGIDTMSYNASSYKGEVALYFYLPEDLFFGKIV